MAECFHHNAAQLSARTTLKQITRINPEHSKVLNTSNKQNISLENKQMLLQSTALPNNQLKKVNRSSITQKKQVQYSKPKVAVVQLFSLQPTNEPSQEEKENSFCLYPLSSRDSIKPLKTEGSVPNDDYIDQQYQVLSRQNHFNPNLFQNGLNMQQSNRTPSTQLREEKLNVLPQQITLHSVPTLSRSSSAQKSDQIMISSNNSNNKISQFNRYVSYMAPRTKVTLSISSPTNQNVVRGGSISKQINKQNLSNNSSSNNSFVLNSSIIAEGSGNQLQQLLPPTKAVFLDVSKRDSISTSPHKLLLSNSLTSSSSQTQIDSQQYHYLPQHQQYYPQSQHPQVIPTSVLSSTYYHPGQQNQLFLPQQQSKTLIQQTAGSVKLINNNKQPVIIARQPSQTRESGQTNTHSPLNLNGSYSPAMSSEVGNTFSSAVSYHRNFSTLISNKQLSNKEQCSENSFMNRSDQIVLIQELGYPSKAISKKNSLSIEQRDSVFSSQSALSPKMGNDQQINNQTVIPKNLFSNNLNLSAKYQPNTNQENLTNTMKINQTIPSLLQKDEQPLLLSKNSKENIPQITQQKSNIDLQPSASSLNIFTTKKNERTFEQKTEENLFDAKNTIPSSERLLVNSKSDINIYQYKEPQFGVFQNDNSKSIPFEAKQEKKPLPKQEQYSQEQNESDFVIAKKLTNNEKEVQLDFTQNAFSFSGDSFMNQAVNTEQQQQQLLQQQQPKQSIFQIKTGNIFLTKEELVVMIESELSLTLESKEIISNKQKQKKRWTVKYKNNCRYEGTLKESNSTREGMGRFVFSNGYLYDGEWKDDQMNGLGTITSASGRVIYEGEFLNNQFSGKGIYYKLIYEGSQKVNFRNLFSQSAYMMRYEGQFKINQFEGFGLIYYSSGERFVGFFENGLATGPGNFYTDSTKINGEWKEGIFIRFK